MLKNHMILIVIIFSVEPLFKILYMLEKNFKDI